MIKKGLAFIGTGCLLLIFVSLGAQREGRADILGVPLHGFADAGIGKSTDDAPARERSQGFFTGTLDLYLTPQFSDHVKSLMEVAFEPGMDSQAYGLDVERIQVGYMFSDKATLWLGRFHTPYGYWNTAYHHGAQIQPSIYKPRFVDWEDHTGFLPAHSVGAWLTGKIPVVEARLQYDLYVINGGRNVGGNLDMNIIKDDNQEFGLGGRLSFKFAAELDGLVLGFHGLTERINAYDAMGPTNNLLANSKLTMLGGFLVYEEKNWEVSSEWYYFMNSDPSLSSGPVTNSWAGFAHVGYSIGSDWVPYIRGERTRIDQLDPFFSLLQNGASYDRAVIGLKYNVGPRAAIKIEGNRTFTYDSLPSFASTFGASPAMPGAFSEVRAQYAISF